MAATRGRSAWSLVSAALEPLGFSRRTRTSRVWIADRGWWLINIEVQPSMVGGHAYLNVGEQHLWVERDHLVFEEFERPLGGSHLTNLEQSAAVERLVAAAATMAEERLGRHGEGVAALAYVAHGNDDLNAGIASALLGNVEDAKRRLSGHVHDAYRAVADAYVTAIDADAVAPFAAAAVDATRVGLKLPPTTQLWSA